MPIHRSAPTYAQQRTETEILETGIKVIDLICPYIKGGKIGLFGGAGVGKTVFMNSVGKQIDQDPTWITIHLIIGDNMVGRLAEMIYQQSTNKIKKYLTNSPILILKLVD